MTWQKPSAQLVELFDACLPAGAGIERRQMFGCPCAFVNGNMFTGLHEQRVVLRLSEAQRDELLGAAKAELFSVMGRTMREYIVIPDALQCPARELSGWMHQALAYAQSLPVKARKAVRAKPTDGKSGEKPQAKKRAIRRR